MADVPETLEIVTVSGLNKDSEDQEISGGASVRPRFYYFHYFVKAGYYCFVMPYNVIYNSAAGQYEIQRAHITRKILVYIMWLITFIRASIWMADAWKHAGLKKLDVLSYFYLASTQEDIAMLVVYYMTVIRNFSMLGSVLQATGGLTEMSDAPPRYRKYLIWALISTLHFGHTFLGILRNLSRGGWLPMQMYSRLLTQGKSMSLLSALVNTNSTEIEQDVNATDTILVLWMLSMHLACYIQIPFILGIVPISSLTLWEGSRSLLKFITTGANVSHIGKYFHRLDELSQAINSIWGGTCLMVILWSCTFTCSTLDNSLKSDCFLYKARNVTVVVNLALGLLLSAESFRNLARFKVCLTKIYLNRNITKEDKLATKLLLKEVKVSTIGVGHVGFYKVDYAFLSMLTTTLLTFFFISKT